ncbi:MAG: hypothetical protein ACTSSG_02545, partial [Candidatus Heimdallarchaeaceae archaeon]
MDDILDSIFIKIKESSDMKILERYKNDFSTKELEFTSSDWVKTIKLKKEEIKKYVSLEKLKLSYDFTTEE